MSLPIRTSPKFPRPIRCPRRKFCPITTAPEGFARGAVSGNGVSVSGVIGTGIRLGILLFSFEETLHKMCKTRSPAVARNSRPFRLSPKPSVRHPRYTASFPLNFLPPVYLFLFYLLLLFSPRLEHVFLALVIVFLSVCCPWFLVRFWF